MALVISGHPAWFRANFRAYQGAWNYVEVGEWRFRYSVAGGTHTISGCRVGSTVLRRVDQGAQPVRGWEGSPLASATSSFRSGEGFCAKELVAPAGNGAGMQVRPRLER